MEEEIKESALMSNSQNFNSLSESWKRSTPQLDDLRKLPPLGLKLTITRSLLDKAQKVLYDARKQHEYKIKAESFPISFLRIGSWQRESRYEGDLVAKCYFAKRKLVWEFLENGLKSKIEFLWSNILSLKAVTQENQFGILEIELNQPPSFHHEIDPEPRKHTQWKIVPDFTGGQASTFRRHLLTFPPGALDKPLEKLLRCDSRLFQLSRQGYPTLESPYFQNPTVGIDFSFDFGVQASNSNVNPENHTQHFQTYQQTMQTSLNHPPMSDEHISNPEHLSQQFQTYQQTMPTSLNHPPMSDEHISNPEHLSQQFQTYQQAMPTSLNHPPMSDEHISNPEHLSQQFQAYQQAMPTFLNHPPMSDEHISNPEHLSQQFQTYQQIMPTSLNHPPTSDEHISNPEPLSQQFQTYQQTMPSSLNHPPMADEHISNPEHLSQQFQTYQQTMPASLNHPPMADEHISNPEHFETYQQTMPTSLNHPPMAPPMADEHISNPEPLSQQFQTYQQTMPTSLNHPPMADEHISNPEHLSEHFQIYQQTIPTSLNHPPMAPPMADEQISNQMPIWNQEINNVRDGLITNPVGGICTPQVHPALVCLQETEMQQQSFQMVNELQNMLSNSQTEFYNGTAESNLYEEGNPSNNTSDVTVNYGENMVDNLVAMNNDLSSNSGSLIYPQAASWSQFQVPEDMSMNLLPGNHIVNLI